MRTKDSICLFVAAVINGFFAAHAPTALAAESKPPIKVVAGYGSADGAVAPLWFAKETKLFEKRNLDVLLVGMGTGSVSLRALIAKDLEIASLSGSGLVQAALQGADTVIVSAAITTVSSTLSLHDAQVHRAAQPAPPQRPRLSRPFRR